MTAKFNKTIFTLAIVAIASTGFSAKADTYIPFSFSNSTGTETVTGEISGLVDGTTGPASKILITSDPLEPGQINVTNWDVITNSFAVNQQGDITSLHFLATNGNGMFYMQGDTAFLQLSYNGPFIASDNLDPPPAAPEPAYLVLTGLGLGGLVFLKFRRNAVRS